MDLADKVRKALVTRIKHYRKFASDGKRRGQPLSQRDLAERVGVSHTTIANIEGEKQYVSVEMLYRLCQALDLELTQLLPEKQDIFGAETADGFSRGERLVEVGGVAHELPEEWANIVQETLTDE